MPAAKQIQDSEPQTRGRSGSSLPELCPPGQPWDSGNGAQGREFQGEREIPRQRNTPGGLGPSRAGATAPAAPPCHPQLIRGTLGLLIKALTGQEVPDPAAAARLIRQECPAARWAPKLGLISGIQGDLFVFFSLFESPSSLTAEHHLARGVYPSHHQLGAALAAAKATEQQIQNYFILIGTFSIR